MFSCPVNLARRIGNASLRVRRYFSAYRRSSSSWEIHERVQRARYRRRHYHRRHTGRQGRACAEEMLDDGVAVDHRFAGSGAGSDDEAGARDAKPDGLHLVLKQSVLPEIRPQP